MRITIIGSGNVATHMAAAFKNAGHQIVQVYSRNLQNALLLAYHVKAEGIDNFEKIFRDTDLFVISVKDDAITSVAERLKVYNKPLVHTSGGTNITALTMLTPDAGVLYPLQTFSKLKEVNFNIVPLCIEGATAAIEQILFDLAASISQNVHYINSAQRQTLHVAAVFACNFPNYLYHIAQQLLADKQLSFDLLKPLIIETADKVQRHLPAQVQTGPAVRNDETTMNKHMELLNTEPLLTQIYALLSQGIIKMDKEVKHTR